MITILVFRFVPMGLLDKISGLTVEGPIPSPRHRKSDPRRGKGVFYRVGVIGAGAVQTSKRVYKVVIGL